jgi:hypothetical protein
VTSPPSRNCFVEGTNYGEWLETGQQRDHRKCWDSLSGLKHAKSLSQGPTATQNKGAVKTKQKPVTVDGRTAHRTLSPKRIPLKTVTNK